MFGVACGSHISDIREVFRRFEYYAGNDLKDLAVSGPQASIMKLISSSMMDFFDDK
jgi:hypothetical protein